MKYKLLAICLLLTGASFFVFSLLSTKHENAVRESAMIAFGNIGVMTRTPDPDFVGHIAGGEFTASFSEPTTQSVNLIYYVKDRELGAVESWVDGTASRHIVFVPTVEFADRAFTFTTAFPHSLTDDEKTSAADTIHTRVSMFLDEWDSRT